ncbi:MAG: hypothetical protein ACI8S6_001365 [Myxococcota bacterium]|jgi:hypothetical protein
MLYIILLLAFFVFFTGAALLFLASAASLIVAALRRRWGVAGISLVLMAVTALPALFTFSVLDGLAWPGRFEPLPVEHLVGSYAVDGSQARLELRSDGGFETSAIGWRELPASGTWSWHQPEAWLPVEQAGYVHLHGDDLVILVLPARRDADLVVERMALADQSGDLRDYLPVRRLEAE